MFVTNLAGAGTGLVLVMDHVLADGVGGLAVLARLVDESSGPHAHAGSVAAPFPAPEPSAWTLAADAWVRRVRRLGQSSASVRAIRHGLAELVGFRSPRMLPRTSLNRPSGPRRRLDVITADLAATRDLGHDHEGNRERCDPRRSRRSAAVAAGG